MENINKNIAIVVLLVITVILLSSLVEPGPPILQGSDNAKVVEDGIYAIAVSSQDENKTLHWYTCLVLNGRIYRVFVNAPTEKHKGEQDAQVKILTSASVYRLCKFKSVEQGLMIMKSLKAKQFVEAKGK